MPPESVLLLEREWITEETVAIYVDYRKYKDKRVQTYKPTKIKNKNSFLKDK